MSKKEPIVSPENKKKMDDLKTGLGAIAEMGHIFYTSMLSCGASTQESVAGMSAFIMAYWHESANQARRQDEEE